MEQLLPLTGERLGAPEGSWDYIYEPDAQVGGRRDCSCATSKR